MCSTDLPQSEVWKLYGLVLNVEKVNEGAQLLVWSFCCRGIFHCRFSTHTDNCGELILIGGGCCILEVERIERIASNERSTVARQKSGD
jgi:hypothetical protein